jgi:sulfatase modifying factor 1
MARDTRPLRALPVMAALILGAQALAFGVAAQEGPNAGPAAAARSERLCAGYSGLPAFDAGSSGREGMAWIPGGRFLMGSDTAYPEEGPRRAATVDGFWMDRHEVTNAQFAAFVTATGYRTVAERGLRAEDYPDLPAAALVPGAMVFFEPKGSEARGEMGEWWRYVPGANWRSPTGPGSSIAGKENHPVVEIAYADAQAYAAWRGRSLPTEAEWEFASRGGAPEGEFAWGDEPTPGGEWMANTWQGFFPFKDDGADGHHGTAPVGCFPANGYGLYDMIGNVWEWATDWYLPNHRFAEGQRGPTGPDQPAATAGGPSHVIKGGSWLCSPNFCLRYRPTARQPQEADLGASHVGFRTVLRGPGPKPN